MIDPITALAAIQSAVKLVKKVSATVDDVGSLGPVLGKYFSAKENAVKALSKAKMGNQSNMGIAIQIEMALEQTKQFEAELQMLFMQAGKVDVWNNIKQRAGAMDKADKFAAQAAEDRAKAKKKEMDETLTILMVIILVVGLAGFFWYVFNEVHDMNQQVHHARKH